LAVWLGGHVGLLWDRFVPQTMLPGSADLVPGDRFRGVEDYSVWSSPGGVGGVGLASLERRCRMAPSSFSAASVRSVSETMIGGVADQRKGVAAELGASSAAKVS
jgi:hypothetical protein